MRTTFFPPVDFPSPLAPARTRFLLRTYLHLLLAMVAFVALEVLFFRSGASERIARPFLVEGRRAWMLALAGFIVVSWLATRVAYRARQRPLQYAALAGFVVAEALLFVPLLVIAEQRAPGSLPGAVVATAIGFVGLTLIVLVLRQDFRFASAAVAWGALVALAAIVASLLFGFELGPLFAVAMVALAGVAILVDTSRLLRSFPVDRPAAAALVLFGSLATMLWWLLRLSSSVRR